MSLIQETDLKIYWGARGTYQSNLPLQSRKKQHYFLLDVITGVRLGKEKGGKSHTKISGKIFKRGLWSERFTKKCSSPLSATEQTNSSPGPSPVWPLVIRSVFITRISPPAQASMTDMSGWHGRYVHTRETKSHFMVYNLVLRPFEERDDGPPAYHTSLEPS